MKKILIVEDEESIRNNLKTILELSDIEGETADNGLNGLSMALEIRPDLIISDVLMPQMDGFQMARKLRKVQAFANVPVIFLTAKVERSDCRQGMEMGAEDYITKPFKAAEVLKAVQVQLQKVEQKDARMRERLLAFMGDSEINAKEEVHQLISGIRGGADILHSFGARLSREEIREISGLLVQSSKALEKLLNLKN